MSTERPAPDAPHGSPPVMVWLHRQLAPEAWPGEGLSPTNRVVSALIVLAAVLTVLESEPALYDIAPLAFIAAEILLVCVFTVEYALRLYAAGAQPRYAGLWGRLRYAITPTALIDLAAIGLFLLVAGRQDTLLLRLVRLVRLIHLGRDGPFAHAIQAVLAALARRGYEMGVVAGITLLLLLLASIALYWAEGEAQPDDFGSIPRAMWWAVATLSTVGYGDAVPITPLGKVIGGITALLAIVVLALPAGILAAALSEAFQRERETRRHLRERRDRAKRGDGGEIL